MNSDIRKLNFRVLPGLASFLLAEKLDESAAMQLEIGREMKLPLLVHFSHLDKNQLLEFSKSGLREFYSNLVGGNIESYIDTQLYTWKHNLIPEIARDSFTSLDITLLNFIRKKIFLHYIPFYVDDINQAMKLVEEINRYYLVLETESLDTFIRIQEQQIEENLHFIEKITETIPALIFVYDIIDHKQIYHNNQYTSTLGYTAEEQEQIGEAVLNSIVHPDDQAILTSHFARSFSEKRLDPIVQAEFRLRLSDGTFRWHRSYVSAFKLTENGEVKQVIGISFDIEEERRVGEELMYREKQLLEAQELAGMGSYEWDILKDESKITPQLAKIVAQNSNAHFSDFMAKVHPLDRERVENILKEALTTTGLYDCEFRFITDGIEKILWSRGIVKFEDGVAVSMNGTVMDITQSQHMIRMLQQSENLHKQAQALTKMGNWTWDINNHTVTWTDELFRIFGMRPQEREINYAFIQNLVHPEDRAYRDQVISNSIKTGEPYDIYYRVILNDKSQKIMHGRGEVLWDEQGKPYKMIGTLQDVTNHKTTEAKLRENQTFVQKIADAAPSVISSFSVRTGRFTFVSLGLKKLLGYDPGQMLEEGIQFLQEKVHPDDLNTLIEKNMEALRSANQSQDNSQITDFVYRIRHINGRYRWFHTYGTIFNRHNSGNVEQVLNISLDITDRIEAEQKIAQKTLELQQSNASLEEFAHVASHDLKEPLRKISTFGDRLYSMQNELMSEDARTYLQKIIESSRRMQQLIDDLLSVSVISSEKTFVRYPLKEIVQEVLSSLEYKIEEKNAVIHVDTPHEIPIVPSQFRQLFQNLISNSLKFVKSDTTPEVVIHSVLARPWQVSIENLKAANLFLKIVVKDNGIGFKKEFSDQIFSIFQRLHPRSKYEGTGIGLAICKKIVENHGGIIYAESVENVGSEFIIIIPL